jgi:hypothetical protein
MELYGSFKPALVDLLAKYPIEAIIMGQRRIDPDAGSLTRASIQDISQHSVHRLIICFTLILQAN